MLKLQFALWRRDVALRKAARINRMGVRERRHTRRLEKLQQRAERWAIIANALVPDLKPQ